MKKYDTYLTPYEKLKSLPDARKYLKLGVTFAALDKLAYEKSDNEFAEMVEKKKCELFSSFKNQNLLFPTTFSSRTVATISGSSLD